MNISSESFLPNHIVVVGTIYVEPLYLSDAGTEEPDVTGITRQFYYDFPSSADAGLSSTNVADMISEYDGAQTVTRTHRGHSRESLDKKPNAVVTCVGDDVVITGAHGLAYGPRNVSLFNGSESPLAASMRTVVDHADAPRDIRAMLCAGTHATRESKGVCIIGGNFKVNPGLSLSGGGLAIWERTSNTFTTFGIPSVTPACVSTLAWTPSLHQTLASQVVLDFVAGGCFTHASMPTQADANTAMWLGGVGRYDGSDWSAFGSGCTSFHHPASSGDTANRFTPTTYVRTISTFPPTNDHDVETSSRWTTPTAATSTSTSTPWPPHEPESIAISRFVVIGGDFAMLDGVTVNGVARWDINNKRTLPMGTGVRGTVLSTCTTSDARIFVGGHYCLRALPFICNIAEYVIAGPEAHRERWETIGPPIKGTVHSLLLAPDVNVLWIGGSFTPLDGGSDDMGNDMIDSNGIVGWNLRDGRWIHAPMMNMSQINMTGQIADARAAGDSSSNVNGTAVGNYSTAFGAAPPITVRTSVVSLSWCGCGVGYEFNATTGGCVDINECTGGDGHHACSSHALCVNTHGSYSCVCRDGFHHNVADGFDCVEVCVPGTYREEATMRCLPCDVGTFQSSFDANYCVPCPVDTSTLSTGISNPIDCVSPFTSDTIVSNTLATGSTHVTLIGGYTANVRDDLTVQVKIGSTQVEALRWISSTSVALKSPSWISPLRRPASVAVTVLPLVRTVSCAFSMDAMLALSGPNVHSTNSATSGGVSLTLLGNGFWNGLKAAQRLGGTGPMHGTRWVSQTCLQIRAAWGHSPHGVFVVSVGPTVRTRTVTSALTWDSPLLASHPRRRFNTCPTGSISATILGSNLLSPQQQHSMRLRLIGTGAVETNWKATTAVTAKRPTSLWSTIVELIRVTVVDHPTLQHGFSIDGYACPGMPHRGIFNGFVTGATSVTVIGTLAGADTASSLIRLARTASMASVWVSETSIRCMFDARIYDSIASESVAVTIAPHVEGTCQMTFTADHPHVSSLVASNSPMTQGVSVTVVGSIAGRAHRRSGRTVIGDSTAAGTVWSSHSAVSAKVCAGITRCTATIAVTTSLSSMHTLTNFITYRPLADLSSIRSHNSPCTGSRSVTVVGVAWSTSSSSPTAAISVSLAEASVWRSDTALTTLTTSMSLTKASANVAVTSRNTLSSTMSDVLTHQIVHLSSIHPTNTASSGGMTVTVLGVGFGTRDQTNAVNIASVPVDITVWQSNTALHLRCALFQWKSEAVVVTELYRIHTLSHAITYSADPIMTSVNPTNVGATAATEVTILGWVFGLTDLSLGGAQGGTWMERTVWTSMSVMTMKRPMGFSTNHTVQATTYAAITGCFYSVFTYDRKHAADIHARNRIVTASSSVTIIGKGLTSIDWSPFVRLGGTAVQVSRWVSSSAIQGKSELFTGDRRSVSITMAHERLGSATNVGTMDNPLVSSTVVTNIPTTGVTSVTLIGVNMHHSVTTQTTHTTSESTIWTSSTSVRSRSCASVSRSIVMCTTVARHWRTSVAALTASIATISSDITANSATTSSISVTVVGGALGLCDNSQTARLGTSQHEGSHWKSSSALLSKAVYRSQGRGLSAIGATVALIHGTRAAWLSLDGVMASEAIAINRPSTSSSSVTVIGRNIGPHDITTRSEVIGTASGTTRWQSSTGIVCNGWSFVQPMFRVGVTAQVTRRATHSQLYTHDAVALSNLLSTNAARSGSTSVTVIGTRLRGMAQTSPSGQIGHTSVSMYQWVSTSAVHAKSMAGSRHLQRVTATSATLLDTVTRTLSYDALKVSSTKVSNSIGTGGTSVTIVGSSQGSFWHSTSARQFGSGAMTTRWVSESCIVPLRSAAVGRYRSTEIAMTSVEQRGSRSFALTLDHIHVSENVRHNTGVTGVVSVTVLGRHMSRHDFTTKSHISSTATGSTDWRSESAVVGKVARSTVMFSLASVTLNHMALDSLTGIVTADVPIASSIAHVNVPATASTSVTVLGVLSSISTTACQRISISHTETTLWISDSCLRSKYAHSPRPSSVAVTIDHRVQSSPGFITIDIATASSSEVTNLPATAACFVKVLGSGSGPYFPSVSGRIGSSGLMRTRWVSYSSLNAMPSTGVRQCKAMVVSAFEAIGRGSLTNTFSYGETSDISSGNAQILISPKSPWVFFAQGSDPGPYWRSLELPEFIFPVGPAPLGYGHASVATTVPHGPNALNKFVTTYLRKSFNNPFSPGDIATLYLHIMYNSGLAVYLGPAEVARLNMHGGTLQYDDLSNAPHTSTTYETIDISSSTGQLAFGPNVISAELHIDATDTTATFFDIWVTASTRDSVALYNSLVTGGSYVTVIGQQFGRAGTTGKSQNVRCGRSSQGSTIWKSETSMRGRRVLSFGMHHSVGVTSDTGLGTFYRVMTFYAVQSSSTTYTNGPATGAMSVTILGTSMGIASSAAVRFANTAVECMKWVSESSISIRKVATLAVSMPVLLTMHERLVSHPKINSYDSPNPSSISSCNTQTTGSFSVTVLGTFHLLRSLTTTLGHSSIASTVWISSSAVIAKSLAGGHAGVAVGVTAQQLQGTMYEGLTYDLHAMPTFAPTNGERTGAASVTMVGNMFPHSTSARLRPTTVRATQWTSDTMLRCLPAGIWLACRTIGTTSALQVSTTTNILTYTGFASSVMRTNTGDTGALSVTVVGTVLGEHLLSLRNRLAGSGGEATRWAAQTSLVSKSASDSRFGVRQIFGFTVLPTTCPSTLTSLLTHGALRPSNVVITNTYATASQSVTVLGTNLQRSMRLSFMGGTVSMGVVWASASAIVFKSPPTRALPLMGRSVAFTSAAEANVVTMSRTLTIDRVLVFHTPLRSNAVSTGAVSVTVIASHLRRFDSTRIRVALSAWEATEWFSDSYIRSKSAVGTWQQLRIGVTAAFSVGTSSQCISFDVAPMRNIRNFHPTSAVSVTVIGQRGVVYDSSPVGRVGATTAMATLWTSDTILHTKWGHASSTIRIRGRHIGMTTGGGSRFTGTATQGVSYDYPSLSDTVRSNLPTSGGITVSLIGYTLNNWDISAKARLSGTASATTRWQATTSTFLRIPGGSLHVRRLQSSAAVSTGSITQEVTYDLPFVESRHNFPSTGGRSVTMLGKRFTMTDVSQSLRFGRTRPAATKWVSESCVRVKGHSAAGSHQHCFLGVPVTIQVTENGEQTFGTTSLLASYNIAESSSVVSTNVPNTGASSVTVLGRCFTQTGPSARGRVSGTGVITTRWRSDTSLLFRRINRYTPSSSLVATVGTFGSTGAFGRTTVKMSSYDQFWLSDAVRTNTPSTATMSVTVIGIHSGLSSTFVTRFRSTVAGATQWDSESSINLKFSSHDVIRQSSLRTTVAAVATNSLQRVLTLDGVLLSGSTPSNIATTGSLHVTIVASNVNGEHAVSSGVRLWRTHAPSSLWRSTTSMVSKSCHGFYRLSFVVTSDREGIQDRPWGVQTTSTVLTYDSFSLAAIESILEPTTRTFAVTGASKVAVLGVDFGTLLQTTKQRMGHSGAEQTQWRSETYIAVKMASGHESKTGWPIVTSLSSTPLTILGAVSYRMQFDGAGSKLIGANYAASGAVSVTVIAQFTHHSSLSTRARSGNSAWEMTAWTSDSALRSKVTTVYSMCPSAVCAITTSRKRATLDVAGTFDHSTFISSAIHANTHATGSISITVIGRTGFSGTARVGGSTTESTQWTSQTALRGRVHGTFLLHCIVGVTSVREPASMASMVTTDATILQDFAGQFGRNVATSASVSVTVIGSLAPIVSLTTRLRTVTSASATVWVSSSSVYARHGVPFQSGNVVFAATTTPYTDTGVFAMSVDLQQASSIVRTNLHATGALSVTVIGRSAGEHATLLAKIVGTSPEATIWVASTSVMVYPSTGWGVGKNIAVTLIGRVSCLTTTMTHDFNVIAQHVDVKPIADNAPQTGATSVTIISYVSPTHTLAGTHAAGHSVSRRIGGSNVETTHWVSTSSLITRAVGCTGDMRGSMSVTMQNEYRTIDVAFTINAPSASAISHANHPNTGATSFTIVGSNIGRFSTPRSRLTSPTQSEATTWVAESSLKLKDGVGLGGWAGLVVTDSEQAGTRFAAISSGYLLLSSVTKRNIHPSGAMSVTIVGESLGSGITACSRLGGSSSAGLFWASTTTMSTKSTAGWGVMETLLMTESQRTSSVSNVITYHVHAIPALGSVTPVRQNIGSTGSISVTVIGDTSNGHTTGGPTFGDVSQHRRIGVTGVVATDWVSMTSLTGKVACTSSNIGRKTNPAFTVTVVTLHQSIYAAWSSEWPTLISQNRRNGAGTGAMSVTVVGTNLGSHATARGRVFSTTTVESSIWLSSSSVFVKGVAGWATTTALLVTTAMREADSPCIDCAYSATLVTMMTFDHAFEPNAERHNAAPTGAMSVTVVGTAMDTSTNDRTTRSRLGRSVAPGTVWVSDSSLQGKSSHAEARCVSRGVGITTAVMYSTFVTSLTFDYRSRLSSAMQLNTARTGSLWVTVVGRMEQTSVVRRRFTLMAASTWVSNTALTSKQAANVLHVSCACVTNVHQRASMSNQFTTDGVTIIDTMGQRDSNIAPSGGSSVTIVGVLLGNFDVSPRVHVLSEAAATAWVSTTALRSRLSTPQLEASPMSLTVLPFRDTSDYLISIDLLIVSSTIRSNMYTTASATVTVIGSNVWSVASPCARLSPSAARSTSWKSASSVATKIAAGFTYTLRTAITESKAFSTLQGTVTFDFNSLPLHGDVIARHSNAPLTGAVSVTVVSYAAGNKLLGGVIDLSTRRRAGATSLEATQWVSLSSVVGRGVVAAGNLAKFLALTMYLEWRTIDIAFSMAHPTIDTISHSNVPSTGAVSVTVVGENIGAFSTSRTRLVSASQSEATAWVSATSTYTKDPHRLANFIYGVSTTTALMSHTAMSVMSWSLLFVSSTIGTNGSPTGSTSVTVVGSNLGRESITALGRFGGTAVRSVAWHSDTSLVTKSVSGWGLSLDMAVTEKHRWASLSSLVTYHFHSIPHNIGVLPMGLNTAATGATSVTVISTDSHWPIGTQHCDYTAKRRLGHTGLEMTAWVSVTSLGGKMARASVNIADSDNAYIPAFAMTLEGQRQTLRTIFTIDWPRLDSHRSNAVGSGATSVTVVGCTVGPIVMRGGSLTLRISVSKAESTMWVSTSSIQAKMSSARTLSEFTAVTTAMNRASPCIDCAISGTLQASITFDYGALAPTVSPTNTATTGSCSVTVISALTSMLAGSVADWTTHHRLGRSVPYATLWRSSSAVLAKTPGGFYGSTVVSLGLTVQVNAISNIVAITVNLPLVSRSVATNKFSTGAVSVTVVGVAFGRDNNIASVGMRVSGPTHTPAMMWCSSTAIVGKTTASTTVAGTLGVTVAALHVPRAATLTNVVSVDLLMVSDTVRTNVHGSGSISVTLVGRSFGIAGLSKRPRFKGTITDASVWVASTSVVCKSPKAYSFAINSAVTVESDRVSLQTSFSYDDIDINSCETDNGGCSMTAICTQQVTGSVVCDCIAPTVGNGVHCAAIFDYTGSPQSWTVPVNCHTVTFKMWGGGGGGFGLTGSKDELPGGAGGYSIGSILANQGEEFEIHVAQGGRKGVANGGTTAEAWGWGKGAPGVAPDSSTWSIGGGGGGSAVFRNGVLLGVAGGGGGKAGESVAALDLSAGQGGGASGTVGGDALNGRAGSQTTPGAKGLGTVANGLAGKYRNGGTAVLTEFGGGGGGGFFGGGGGAVSTAKIGSGGGGSGYFVPWATATSTLAGSAGVPPETSVHTGGVDWVEGIGIGGTSWSTGGSYADVLDGGHGRVSMSCERSVNECATSNGGCHADADCTNTPASNTCVCKTGFLGNGINCAASDVNECAWQNGGCDVASVCTNSVGSFSCACHEGWTGTGRNAACTLEFASSIALAGTTYTAEPDDPTICPNVGVHTWTLTNDQIIIAVGALSMGFASVGAATVALVVDGDARSEAGRSNFGAVMGGCMVLFEDARAGTHTIDMRYTSTQDMSITVGTDWKGNSLRSMLAPPSVKRHIKLLRDTPTLSDSVTPTPVSSLSLSVTLAADTQMLVVYTLSTTSSSGAGFLKSYLTLDGTPITASECGAGLLARNSNLGVAMVDVSAGAHTFAVLYSGTGGLTGGDPRLPHSGAAIQALEFPHGMAQVLNARLTGTVALAATGSLAAVPGLTLTTPNFARPILAIISYQLSAHDNGEDELGTMITQLKINGAEADGTRTARGASPYWSNQGVWIGQLAAGVQTIQVWYEVDVASTFTESNNWEDSNIQMIYWTEDVNECLSNNGGCNAPAICINDENPIGSSARCRCPPGYGLDTAGTSCTDINECTLSSSAPTQPTIDGLSGKLLWLRGGTGVSLAGGGKVDSWADQSGNSNHAGQSNSGLRPLPGTSIRGLPTIDFNGGHVLTTPSITMDKFSFWAVVDFPSLTSSSTSYVIQHGNDAAYLVANIAATVLVQRNSILHGLNAFVTQWRVPSSGPKVAMIQYDYDADEPLVFRVNGQKEPLERLYGHQYDSYGGTESVTAALNIGANSVGGTGYTGAIAEIVVFNRALSDAEIGQMESFLFDAWVGCDNSQGTCTNTAGSFTCGCVAGYYLTSTLPGGRACVACPVGKYKDSSNADVTCSDCSAGTYNTDTASTGVSACLTCHATRSSAAGASTCYANAGYTGADDGPSAAPACAAGKYKASAGSVACDDCVAGKYKAQGGQSSDTCNSCMAGSTSTAGSATYNSCLANAGYTGQGAGVTVCVAGKYKATAASSIACTDCAANKFKSATTQTSDTCVGCTTVDANSGTDGATGSAVAAACLCNPGYTGTQPSCTGCSANTYKTQYGAAACIACPANSSPSSPGESECPCNAGYNWNAGTGACDACPAGKYKTAIGVGTCDDCVQGKYGMVTGWSSDLCVACPVNSNTDGTGTDHGSGCKCNTGYGPGVGGLVSGSGTVACPACAAGKYKADFSQAQCTDCPANSGTIASASAALTDCLCTNHMSGPAGGPCTAAGSATQLIKDTASPYALYHLDETTPSSGAYDEISSSTSTVGSPSGSVTSVTGPRNTNTVNGRVCTGLDFANLAFSFNLGYVQVSTTYGGSSTATLAFWAKSSNTDTYKRLFSSRDTTNDFVIMNYNGYLGVSVLASNENHCRLDLTYNDGQWHYWVVRRHSSTHCTGVSALRDGVVSGVTYTSQTTYLNMPVTSGYGGRVGSTYSEVWQGDMVAGWSTAISDAQAQAIFNAMCPP